MQISSVDDPVEVVLLSVPYCEPLPMVAPVLLSGCLSAAGVPARGIDFNIEFLKTFKDDPCYIEFKNFLTMGHTFRPDFPRILYRRVIRFTKNFLIDCHQRYKFHTIGLSIFTSESLDFGLIMIYLIRKYLPGIKIIVGGKGLEVIGADGRKIYETWHQSRVADTIVVGDSEQEIINVIKQDKWGLVQTILQKKEDLDNIPLAKWQDYDLNVYSEMSVMLDRANTNLEPYLTVTASKGCVRKCTFCDVASFWPEYIYRDPIKVAYEIIHNYKSTGIRNFKFTDNLINGSISNYRKMNQILVDNIPKTISYNGFAIFRGKHQMPEDDFRLASEAGCSRWTIGVESGSEKVRYDMKKKFSNDDLDWSISMLHRYKIRQNWLFIVGFPSEGESDFQETLSMLKRYSWLANTGMVTVSVTPTFMLLENSPLLNDAGLMEYHGLNHVKSSGPMMNKFWTSTKFVDNDYPTRSRRWKEFINLSEQLGFQFGPGMPVQKWKDEIANTDKLYAEQKYKIIPINPGK